MIKIGCENISVYESVVARLIRFRSMVNRLNTRSLKISTFTNIETLICDGPDSHNPKYIDPTTYLVDALDSETHQLTCYACKINNAINRYMMYDDKDLVESILKYDNNLRYFINNYRFADVEGLLINQTIEEKISTTDR